jgi:hypothetical protein
LESHWGGYNKQGQKGRKAASGRLPLPVHLAKNASSSSRAFDVFRPKPQPLLPVLCLLLLLVSAPAARPQFNLLTNDGAITIETESVP